MNIFWSLLGVFSTIGGIIAYVTTQNVIYFAIGFLVLFCQAWFRSNDDEIIKTDTEYSAVQKSLEWARSGDFLALLVHDDRVQTMELLAKLRDANWQAGDPLPT